MKRIVFSERFRETIGKKVITSLKREDPATTYAAIEFLNALMQVNLKDAFYLNLLIFLFSPHQSPCIPITI